MPPIAEVVEKVTQRYLSIFRAHLTCANGTKFYTADLMMFAILNRNIGLLNAMPALFQTKNIHALAPLLRVQLDSLLRLHAFRIVESMEDLAVHVMRGNHLANFKDRDGNRLKDKRLVETLKTELPWVEEMYETLSSWIHFSESHVFSAVAPGIAENSVVVGIGDLEREIPDQLFVEACSAVGEIHDATATLLNGYFDRNNPTPNHLL